MKFDSIESNLLIKYHVYVLCVWILYFFLHLTKKCVRNAHCFIDVKIVHTLSCPYKFKFHIHNVGIFLLVPAWIHGMMDWNGKLTIEHYFTIELCQALKKGYGNNYTYATLIGPWGGLGKPSNNILNKLLVLWIWKCRGNLFTLKRAKVCQLCRANTPVREHMIENEQYVA